MVQPCFANSSINCWSNSRPRRVTSAASSPSPKRAPENALLKTPRVAALERLHLRRRRTRVPPVVILLEKQQIDLRGRAPESRLLQHRREGAHLLEVSGQQLIGDAARLAQIIFEIG